jgi:hypothetical protein
VSIHLVSLNVGQPFCAGALLEAGYHSRRDIGSHHLRTPAGRREAERAAAGCHVQHARTFLQLQHIERLFRQADVGWRHELVVTHGNLIPGVSDLFQCSHVSLQLVW